VREGCRLSSWVLILANVVGLGGAEGRAAIHLKSVTKSDLCVTEGSIEPLPGQRLSVRVPKMRAYLNAFTPQVVEARFTYLGSTGNEARLGSGELRRQFGLKLHAQDACNLVYVMWRVEPEAKLVVSVKSNPGQHTSAQCANRGYRNIKPSRSAPVVAMSKGSAHSLRAEMKGEQLTVLADNAMVWQGSVGQQAAGLKGPVGIRSDNAALQLELRVALPMRVQGEFSPGCRSGGEQE
jgi:hypothetical protein